VAFKALILEQGTDALFEKGEALFRVAAWSEVAAPMAIVRRSANRRRRIGAMRVGDERSPSAKVECHR
jgi:hypothetical protein